MKRKPEERKITLNEVHYDWFTLTNWEDSLYQRFKRFHEGADDIREAKRMQYDGQVSYSRSGSLFAGTAHQDGQRHNMVVISGGLANQFENEVKESIKEDFSKLTRVDIQATIQEPDDYELNGQWRLFNRLKRNGQTVGWVESQDYKYGEMATVYRGSMKSERMARCYQKGAAHSRPLLRLEFVLKGRQAESYGKAWVTGKTNKRKTFKALLEWFGDRVISNHFESVVEGFVPFLPKVVKAETKTERWLMGTVLNTFTRVINEHGTHSQVRRAFKRAIEESEDRFGPP